MAKTKLLDKKTASKLPHLGATEDQADPMVQAKWFTPDGNWTWLALEHEPATGVCFGFVSSGYDGELGYFSLDELATVRGRFGLPVERDLYFRPEPLSAIREQYERRSA